MAQRERAPPTQFDPRGPPRPRHRLRSPTANFLLRLLHSFIERTLPIIGLVVHILIWGAIFDIYFLSTIHHGMPAHKPEGIAPARRVVIFVVNGLRAETLYEDNLRQYPFLEKMSENGLMGISYAGALTESRSGHVAMLAGFYEDPSLINRMWEIPVPFDSIINESTNAYCWGSPDVLDLFLKERVPDQKNTIHINTYGSHVQDFSRVTSPSTLDVWVFDQVKLTFAETLKKPACENICDFGNIFFLHLLGVDTAGRTWKPPSLEYTQSISVVEKGVEHVYEIIENFFGDKKTAYIFTSDYGLTNWGSHGSTTPHEHQLPFLAWGAGIVRHLSVIHIDQIDIAPMVSALLGIGFPTNSMGVVPLNYLDVPKDYRAQVMHANAFQLAEKYMMKHEIMRTNTFEYMFYPFPHLPNSEAVYEKMNNSQEIINSKRYNDAITYNSQLINLFKKGLNYYENYYHYPLLYAVTFGFLGWILFICNAIADFGTMEYFINRKKRNELPWWFPEWPIYCLLAIGICLLPLMNQLPLRYTIYFVFPLCTWCMALGNFRNAVVTLAVLQRYTKIELMNLFFFYFVGIALLILSFSHSIFIVVLFAFIMKTDITMNAADSQYFISAQSALIVLPLIVSLQTKFEPVYQAISVGLWVYYVVNSLPPLMAWKDKIIIFAQLGILITALGNGVVVDSMVKNGMGVHPYCQHLSWSILTLALTVPFTTSTQLQTRLLSVIIGLVTPYTLMAVGFECIFIYCLAIHLLNWMKLMHKKMQSTMDNTPELYYYDTNLYWNVTLTTEESVRQCFYLLCYIMLSFLGLGNHASINSFDPMWTRCFITMQVPSVITILIVLKLVLPFLIVMCVFYGVMFINQSKIRNNFLIILLFCDIMVFNFMFFVKNEGSWLEVGIKMSHFVVGNILAMVMLLLYLAAHLLVTLRISLKSRLPLQPPAEPLDFAEAVNRPSSDDVEILYRNPEYTEDDYHDLFDYDFDDQ